MRNINVLTIFFVLSLPTAQFLKSALQAGHPQIAEVTPQITEVTPQIAEVTLQIAEVTLQIAEVTLQIFSLPGILVATVKVSFPASLFWLAH